MKKLPFLYHRLNNQNGFTTLVAIATLAILSITGIYALNVSTTEQQITTNVDHQKEAFYQADAGVQHTLAVIRNKIIEEIEDGNLKDIDSIDFDTLIDFSDSVYQSSDFSFDSPSKEGSWGASPYKFQITGHGPRNAASTIEVAFTPDVDVDKAFKVGILSDGDININGAPDMLGSLHANGSVTQSGEGNIDGNVSAVGTVDVDSTVTGDSKPGADPMDVPKVSDEDFAEWETNADVTYSGDTTLDDSDIGEGDIIFVDGNVTIQNKTEVKATIIATGDVTFNGQSTIESPGDNPALETLIIAGGNITFNGSGDSWGVFWSNGSFSRNGSSDVNGSVVAGDTVEDLDIEFNGTFSFDNSENIDNEFVPKEMTIMLTSWSDQVS